MIIFPSSNCPIRSAKALNDEMIEESLFNVNLVLMGALSLNKVSIPLKLNKIVLENPYTIWASNNYKNYLWTLDYLIALINERKYRFPEKEAHYSESFMAWILMDRHKIPNKFDIKEKFPFENVGENQITKVRKILESLWNNMEEIPTWTKRKPPVWSLRNNPEKFDKLDETSYNFLEV